MPNFVWSGIIGLLCSGVIALITITINNRENDKIRNNDIKHIEMNIEALFRRIDELKNTDISQGKDLAVVLSKLEEMEKRLDRWNIIK